MQHRYPVLCAPWCGAYALMPVVQNWLQGLGQCIGGSKVLAPWLMPRPPSRFLGGVSEPLFWGVKSRYPTPVWCLKRHTHGLRGLGLTSWVIYMRSCDTVAFRMCALARNPPWTQYRPWHSWSGARHEKTSNTHNTAPNNH